MDINQPCKHPNRTRTKRHNRKSQRGGIKNYLRKERRSLFKELTSRSAAESAQQELPVKPYCSLSSEASSVDLENNQPSIKIIKISSVGNDSQINSPSPLSPIEFADTGTATYSGLDSRGNSKSQFKTIY